MHRFVRWAARLTQTHTGVLSAALAAAVAGPVAASHSDGTSSAAGSSTTAAADSYGSLPDMIESVFPALCKIQSVGRLGRSHVQSNASAFVIDSAGTIASNLHAFDMPSAGVRDVRCLFDDGSAYAVQFLAGDVESDIAVARLVAPEGAPPFRAMRFGRSGALRRGEPVVVLGAPLGGSLVPASGIACGRRFVGDDATMMGVLNSRADWQLLQLDAPLSSGNSGGPVVNANGEVVGVAVMVQSAAPGYGGGPAGVGSVSYAVASDQAAPIVRALLAQGRVLRPVVGLSLVPVNRIDSERHLAASGAPLLPPAAATGLFVARVSRGSPAEAAGLQPGDVVTAIDGAPARRLGDYFSAVGPVYDSKKRLLCAVFRPGGESGGHIFAAVLRPAARESTATQDGASALFLS